MAFNEHQQLKASAFRVKRHQRDKGGQMSDHG